MQFLESVQASVQNDSSASGNEDHERHSTTLDTCMHASIASTVKLQDAGQQQHVLQCGDMYFCCRYVALDRWGC